MHPTVLTLFGATGDLAEKKIIPALYELFRKKELPEKFHIIAFTRRELTDTAFREKVAAVLNIYGGEANELGQFLRLFSYVRGRYDHAPDYAELALALKNIDATWRTTSNKLFFLAVRPEQYELILKHMKEARLALPDRYESGWTRFMLEKPFGTSLRSAMTLEKLLLRVADESNIFRIDHSLAREMLQNVLALRFSNSFFEGLWSAEHIERITLRYFEDIGVETRGAFYDALGAFRDVGQNHLLSTLSVLAMERPKEFTAPAIHERRSELLENLAPLTPDKVRISTRRAQYAGYRGIEHVAANSQTETYFKVMSHLTAARWEGVPIVFEAGKRLGVERKEVEILLRHETPCLCPPGEHLRNRIVFHFDKKEGATFHFFQKKPGSRFALQEKVFFLPLRESGEKQRGEEYEKIIGDALRGDKTLFVSKREIQAMWRFADSVLAGWQKNAVPLETYAADTLPDVQNDDLEVNQSGSWRITCEHTIGLVGLGKMGAALMRQMSERGWSVIGTNRSPEPVSMLRAEGLGAEYSVDELLKKLKAPRIIWLMLTAGKPIDELLFGRGALAQKLSPGDIVIDGGNSFFEDSVRRAKLLRKRGIEFSDAGVSGGPSGARHGASIMIGGERRIYEKLEPLIRSVSRQGGYGYMGKAGAGHFVKMVHNGIEYGMMQALAEGFAIMRKFPNKLDFKEVLKVYNHGSVIESRLTKWLDNAFWTYGNDLKGVTGKVAHTGEGEWTVKTGKKFKVPAPIIEGSFKFRVASHKKPSYTGQILSALRNQFGGHSLKDDKK